MLKRILEQREEDHAELNTKRLDRLWWVDHNFTLQFYIVYDLQYRIKLGQFCHDCKLLSVIVAIQANPNPNLYSVEYSTFE